MEFVIPNVIDFAFITFPSEWLVYTLLSTLVSNGTFSNEIRSV